MIDQRFFTKSQPLSLEEIAQKVGAITIFPEGSKVRPDFLMEDITAMGEASDKSITFLHNPRYKNNLVQTKAAACITQKTLIEGLDVKIPLVLCEHPYRAFATIAHYFYKVKEDAPPAEYKQVGFSFIHPTAQVDPTVSLGHNVVVGPDAVIKARTRIAHNVTICRGVEIGEDCIIEPHVTLQCALIGNQVILAAGVQIGQAGFGFVMDEMGHVPVPQIGRVVIEDGVEIGANTTIDRGTLQDTVIGAGARIDNLVQIGHGVKLGKNCVIVAQVGIAGSTEFGDFVIAAGQAGFAGHLRVGKGARIAAQSGVMKDIEPGATVAGSPAVPVNSWHRQNIMLSKLATKR